MAKDKVALLRRFLADEDAAFAEGREGTLWEKESARLLPLIGRAWQMLLVTETERLYTHVLRRTHRLPSTSPNAFAALLGAYQKVAPKERRIGFCFRFGFDASGLLPSGIVEGGGELAKRHQLLERFSGHPDLASLLGKARRFEKDARRYARPALEALRHTGWSEDSTPEGAPRSLEALGLVVIALLAEPTRSDALDEIRALEAEGEAWAAFRTDFEAIALSTQL